MQYVNSLAASNPASFPGDRRGGGPCTEGRLTVHCTCTVYRDVMVLNVDPEATTPVYRQIVDGLRVALVNGELAPGDPLPSVRRLALDIGVHFNTVAQAYRELAREGWFQISGRGGAQVRERAVPP